MVEAVGGVQAASHRVHHDHEHHVLGVLLILGDQVRQQGVHAETGISLNFAISLRFSVKRQKSENRLTSDIVCIRSIVFILESEVSSSKRSMGSREFIWSFVESQLD